MQLCNSTAALITSIINSFIDLHVSGLLVSTETGADRLIQGGVYVLPPATRRLDGGFRFSLPCKPGSKARPWCEEARENAIRARREGRFGQHRNHAEQRSGPRLSLRPLQPDLPTTRRVLLPLSFSRFPARYYLAPWSRLAQGCYEQQAQNNRPQSVE